MATRKSKQKTPAASTPPQNPLDNIKRFCSRAMQRLFSLPADWHKNRDIVKNNYLLGMRFLVLGSAADAILRFKFATWFDAKHQESWVGMARAYLMAGKRAQAEQALNKALSLNAAHAKAKQLLKAMPAVGRGKDNPTTTLWEVKSDSASVLAALHRDGFLKAWDEKTFTEMLAIEGTQAWVAGTAEVAMGMIIGRALGEQYEILTLAVSPEWRGRGIARQLLETLTARAGEAGAKTIFLDVAVDNEAALHLYENANYAAIKTRPAYYRNTDGVAVDAVVMSRAV